MINYQKRVLDNGLTVIAEQDKSTTMCAVNILYKVGSRNEDPEKTGFAHLFEHLMFGGSKHALATQQKVVIEEFKEVCLNKPYGESWHHLSALAYEKHPYKWPTIGKVPEHIERAHLDDVKSFYEKHYQPANAILTISGPLREDEVFGLAEKYFGHIEGKGSTSNQLSIQEPLQEGSRYKLVQDDVPAPLFLLGYHMPERNSDDYYACDLLSDILSNGKSSRMYTSLVRQKKLFSMLDCYVTGTFDPGLIIVEARPMPEVSIAVGLEAIEKEIAALKTNPITDRELQKVKNKVISSLAISDLNILNKAISMAYFEWLDSLALMNRQEELYEQVQVKDIIRALDTYMIPSNRSMVEYALTSLSTQV